MARVRVRVRFRVAGIISIVQMRKRKPQKKETKKYPGRSYLPYPRSQLEKGRIRV